MNICTLTDLLKTNYTYRSEDHVQWHCNVEVEGVVVYNTYSEEHGNHYHIVSTEGSKNRDTFNI